MKCRCLVADERDVQGDHEPKSDYPSPLFHAAPRAKTGKILIASLVLTGALLANPAAAQQSSDLDVLLDACRTHDGGLPEATCQCIAKGLTKQELATYRQLVAARRGNDSDWSAFERKNSSFIRKFDDTVKRCQR